MGAERIVQFNTGFMEFVMSNSRRYTSSGSRPAGRDKSTRVTDLRSKRGDEPETPGLHTQISEDSVVDACVDHAHAVARVHGAPEVMLEHLVHALARVPEAANVLEQQGFDVDNIRRESAAIIAADIPVGKPDSKHELYASNDFSTVLHLAAANASRQGEVEISVWDLLDAIAGYDDDLASVRLLNDGAGHGRVPARRDRRPVEPRRRDRGAYERAGASRQFAISSYRSDTSSDELLQQGLAAIETALQRQAEPGVGGHDPRIDEKFELLDAKMSGLVDHRDQEIKELKELVATLNVGRDDDQTKAVHADLIALREAVDKREGDNGNAAMQAELVSLREGVERRDAELREASMLLERRLDDVRDNVGLIAADPQTGLRDEIRALSERIDGSAGKDVSKLTNSFDSRFVNMETLLDARQGEMLGLHSTLGQGVDEQGVRLRGLEARLKDEHDQTQGELRAIRGFLEKIAGTVDHYAEEIDQLRLDHIGDMSVISNQLDDVLGHVEKICSSAGRNRRSIGPGNGGLANGASNPRPTNHRMRPTKASAKPAGSLLGMRERASNVSRQDEDVFEYQAPVEKKLVIDAETTQHVAQRFAGKSRDVADDTVARRPRGSMDHVQGKSTHVDEEHNYRGKKIRRTRSASERVKKGTSLRDRLVSRGAKIKDQYKSARNHDQHGSQPTSTPGSEGPPSWSRRFWDDFKGLFRDDDPRWTDQRK